MAFKKRKYWQSKEKDPLEEKVIHNVEFIATGFDAVHALLSRDYGVNVVRKMAAAELEAKAPWLNAHNNERAIEVDRKGVMYRGFVCERVPVMSVYGFLTKLQRSCADELGEEYAEKVMKLTNSLLSREGYKSVSRINAYELIGALIKGTEKIYKNKIAPERYKKEIFGIGRLAQNFAAEMFGNQVYKTARAKCILDYNISGY